MTKLYQLKHIYKIYENQTCALKNINLAIYDGEMVVILGPSGSGKSTLLNTLSGIDIPSKGKILFKNKRLDLFNENEKREYRSKYLGFIFQNYNLISNLTVKENIELGAKLNLNHLSITEIMKAVGILEYKNKYPEQLSGGQMQRVAIARALVKNPNILFCDEPTGALDEDTGKKVLELLEDIQKKYHTTIIVVTHNPSIASMANTIIKMNSGEIKEIIHNKNIKPAKDLRWA